MVKVNKIFVSTLLFILILAIPFSISLAQASMKIYIPIVLNGSTPTSTIPPTEPPPHITGNVVITTIFYDGSGTAEPDEYVEIKNIDSFAIQLANWTLRDDASHIYNFPSFVVQPGQVCRVYTNENHPEWCGFNYSSGSAIWNNTTDCGYLRDSTNTLIDTFCY